MKGHRKLQWTKNTWERNRGHSRKVRVYSRGYVREDRAHLWEVMSEQNEKRTKDAREILEDTEEDKKYLKQDRGFLEKDRGRPRKNKTPSTEDEGPTCMVEAYSVYWVGEKWGRVGILSRPSSHPPPLGPRSLKWCVCFFVRCNGYFLCTFEIIAYLFTHLIKLRNLFCICIDRLARWLQTKLSVNCSETEE